MKITQLAITNPKDPCFAMDGNPVTHVAIEDGNVWRICLKHAQAWTEQAEGAKTVFE